MSEAWLCQECGQVWRPRGPGKSDQRCDQDGQPLGSHLAERVFTYFEILGHVALDAGADPDAGDVMVTTRDDHQLDRLVVELLALAAKNVGEVPEWYRRVLEEGVPDA